MKIKRTRKEYGGGCCETIFDDSEIFSVIVWHLSKGIRTTITVIDMYYDIHFDGRHEFISDEVMYGAAYF